MATQWVLGKVSEALAPTVSSEGINNSIRRYGDGVKDYGNAIMDWSRADGIRAQTASNPLGLSAGVTGGKRQVTSPQVYRAPPKTSPSKTLMKNATPQKKIEAGTPKMALPAPGPKADAVTKKASSTVAAPVQKHVSAVTPKAPTATKTASTPNPGAMRKKPVDATSNKNGGLKQTTSVKKSTPVKSNGVTASKPANRPKVSGNPTAAANPLGLNF
ncbi:hypothetical protein HRR78_007957 [Exophiala dermatitidis]|nr:hypothetical protein HRR75_000365 [Exophiala dermatitidis]KAJ4539032.1 hypothetical protein HRR78_007957 [Exophiala dermatitidis]